MASLLDEPLDVISIFEALENGESIKATVTPNFLDTPHGLVGVARNDSNGACVLVRIIDLPTGRTERTPLADCKYGSVQAYDPVGDALLVCNVGETTYPILQSRDARTGQLRWGLRPSKLNGTVHDPEVRWTCTGVAVDVERREVVVPLASSRTGAEFPRNRIASLDLDSGVVRWSRQVIATTGSVSALPGFSEADRDGAGPNFIPFIATLTQAGVVVVGASICYDVPTCDPPRDDITRYQSYPVELAMAWFDPAGVPRGFLSAREDAGTNPRRSCVLAGEARVEGVRGGSLGAVADGLEAVARMGECLYKLRPSEAEPSAAIRVRGTEFRKMGDIGAAPGAWGPDGILLPLGKAVTSFHPVDLSEQWSWTLDAQGRDPVAILGTRGGLVWILASPPATREVPESRGTSILYVLDPAAGAATKTASLVQRIELPLRTFRLHEEAIAVTPTPVWTPARTFSQYLSYYNRPPEMTPLDSGELVLSDARGRVVYLGRAPDAQRPALVAASTDLVPGEDLQMSVRPPAGREVAHLVVAWGDGEVLHGAAPIDTDLLRHTYSFAGRYILRATAQYDDGTTGTSSLLVGVADRQERLSPLQVALSPENQDKTFFTVGLLMTVVGSLFALWRRSRRRRRIAAELRRLAEVRQQAALDPSGALRAIEAFRAALREKLMRGRVDDGQFGALELSALQMARGLRERLLAPYDGRISTGFQRQLEAAFEDGFVSASERHQLLGRLSRERALSRDDRRRLAMLIEE